VPVPYKSTVDDKGGNLTSPGSSEKKKISASTRAFAFWEKIRKKERVPDKRGEGLGGAKRGE